MSIIQKQQQGEAMQISGKKMGSVKAVKDSLKKGGSSLNTYIKNVPAEGITVRFLTEPEEWFGFYEYWNDESRNFTPMAVGEILPDGAKASFRYLASVVDVEITLGPVVVSADRQRNTDLATGGKLRVVRNTKPVKLARIHLTPFTERLVAKFELPVHGWRAK